MDAEKEVIVRVEIGKIIFSFGFAKGQFNEVLSDLYINSHTVIILQKNCGDGQVHPPPSAENGTPFN